MNPADRRLRALELAIESSGNLEPPSATVARAEAYLKFLDGPSRATAFDIRTSAPDTSNPAALGRELERAIAAARRADGRA